MLSVTYVVCLGIDKNDYYATSNFIPFVVGSTNMAVWL